VLPFICCVIIIVFLISSGILEEFFYPKPEEAQPAIVKDAVEMVQPRMSGLDKKKRAYEISAEKAKQSVDNPAKVTLENIVGSLSLGEKDDSISLTAKSGIMDTESNFLQLREDIIISSKQGYTAYLISVDAKLKEKYIISKDPVLIEWKDGSIRANGLEITENGDVVRFLNRVKVTFKPKPGKKDVN
jgi:lipopolysaccharide export system protein LptC